MDSLLSWLSRFGASVPAGSPPNSGAAAEDFATRHLQAAGLRIVERNYRTRGGEIDIVAQDGDTLVFVEVRLRTNQRFGGAAASIGAEKQKRIVLAAKHYLVTHGEQNCRFDCVLMSRLSANTIEWIQGAFDI